MIEYVKDKLIGERDSIEEFFEEAHLELIHAGFVHLQLEPGDATRYEFVITDTGDSWLISLINVSCQTCSIGKNIIITSPEVMYWHHSINPHTRALVAEVLNSVRSATPIGLYFNWEAGRAKL